MVYEELTPGNLTLTNEAGQLSAVLGGHAGAPGGNVELFADSENMIFQDSSPGGAFATATTVSLSGTAGSSAFEFRSLNGNDWFGSTSGYDTTYGADTLATRWFDGFLDSVVTLVGDPMIGGLLDMYRESLFDDWRDGGGFASLSDANIGYVYEDAATGQLNFGTEGFLDGSPRFREFLTDSGNGAFVPYVPDGIQNSEVVILNGEVYYSFGNATPSLVELDDEPFNSYTGNFAFVVPEPGTVTLVGAGLFGWMIRRRRSI